MFIGALLLSLVTEFETVNICEHSQLKPFEWDKPIKNLQQASAPSLPWLFQAKQSMFPKGIKRIMLPWYSRSTSISLQTGVQWQRGI